MIVTNTEVIQCPLGCGRSIPSTDDHVHYCVTRNADGSKGREYVGTWDGEALFYGACYDEVERQLRPYREEQLVGIRWTAGRDGGVTSSGSPAEPVFICGACHTGNYGPSAMQPAICYQCVNAWLLGYKNRLDPGYLTRTAVIPALPTCPTCADDAPCVDCSPITTVHDPEPAPPVDDGPEDNFGGFRCSRRAHVAAPTSDLTLPPIALLADIAAELATAAQEAGDTANMHALNKAMMQLHEGTVPVPTTGGFLVESRTRGGVVHRVSTVHGCSCEAGGKGKPCWHAALLEIVEAAQRHAVTAIPTAPTAPFCFFHPGANHDTQHCPKLDEPGFGAPSYSIFN